MWIDQLAVKIVIIDGFREAPIVNKDYLTIHPRLSQSLYIYILKNDMSRLKEGDLAPAITARDQNGEPVTLEEFKSQMSRDFELGLKLVQEKTGRNRFFITRKALMNPDAHLDELIKAELQDSPPTIEE